MRADQAQPTESAGASALTTDVREVESVDVAHGDVLDLAFAVDEDADEPVEFLGEECELGSELLGEELVVEYAATVEAFKLALLAALEASGVAVDLLADDAISRWRGPLRSTVRLAAESGDFLPDHVGELGVG